jgi:hypothetical protein
MIAVRRQELGAWSSSILWEAEAKDLMAHNKGGAVWRSVIPVRVTPESPWRDVLQQSANNPASNRKPMNLVTSPAARRRADNHHLQQPCSLPLIPA